MFLFVKMHLEIFLIASVWATFVNDIIAISVPSHKTAIAGDLIKLKCPDTDKSSFDTIVLWRKQSTNTIISANYNISVELPVDIQDRYSIVDKDGSQFTLRIVDVKQIDEGVYECGYIESKQGKFQGLYSINVTLESINTIDLNPVCSLDASSESSTLTNSSVISLTCSVATDKLSKEYSIQWVREGEVLAKETKTTLSLTNFSLVGLNNLYVCQLLNKNSKIETKECSIKTLEYPVVLSEERNYVKIGNDINITCDVRSSSDVPIWNLQPANNDILKRLTFSKTNRTLSISNLSLSDNNTEIFCKHHNGYTRKATIIVISDTIESTTIALEEYRPIKEKKDKKKEEKTDKHSGKTTKMGLSPTNLFSSTLPSFTTGSQFSFNLPIGSLPDVSSTPSTYVTSSPSPTESLSGFQEFLNMVHMSYKVFIAAAIGTFLFLVLLLILFICCYKHVQSKKPARLAISDSFYSGLANVHKNTNYPLHYNAMHKRSGFGRASGASSLFGEDDMEGSNLLEIIVQGKFPENSDMQFSDTLEHCNPDDSCLSSAKDFCNLNTGAKDYGTSADTLDGTDEGICSGSGETKFDFDFDSPVNTKPLDRSMQPTSEQDAGLELTILKDTLC